MCAGLMWRHACLLHRLLSWLPSLDHLHPAHLKPGPSPSLTLMWHKRHRSRDAEAPAGKRLRDNILDLYGSGEASAERTQELLDDAAAFAFEAGRDDMQDLRSTASAGNVRNVSRDLRKRLLKKTHWPPVYVSEVRTWNTKEKEMGVSKVCLLLPHELLYSLCQVGEFEVLTDASGLDAANRQRHGAILDVLGSPFVSLSIWGDGVPFSWDRKRSADLWSMSLPGMGHKPYRDLRFTLTALPHERVVRETQDDLMQILAWSLDASAKGTFPSQRHDGTDWGPEDNWRIVKAGASLIDAAVLEIKGDWKHMAACFSVPGWSSKKDKPICWRCNCTKESLQTETGLESPWMKPENRLGHYDALVRIVEEDGQISPVFQIPWVTMASLRLDWLHIADQGITPVFLGGLMHLMLSDAGIGRNVEQRCRWLWGQIQVFYRRHGTVDRLHDLTVTMIKPKKGSIELSGSGAQIRALVPFGLGLRWMLRDWLQNSACSISPGATHFWAPMLMRAKGLFWRMPWNPKRWQIRPKLHLFLELAFEGGPPSASWNYREESYGGSVSRQAHRRGGGKSPLAMSRSALTKFCAKEHLPRLVAPSWVLSVTAKAFSSWKIGVWSKGLCKGMSETPHLHVCHAMMEGMSTLRDVDCFTCTSAMMMLCLTHGTKIGWCTSLCTHSHSRGFGEAAWCGTIECMVLFLMWVCLVWVLLILCLMFGLICGPTFSLWPSWWPIFLFPIEVLFGTPQKRPPQKNPHPPQTTHTHTQTHTQRSYTCRQIWIDSHTRTTHKLIKEKITKEKPQKNKEKKKVVQEKNQGKKRKTNKNKEKKIRAVICYGDPLVRTSFSLGITGESFL